MEELSHSGNKIINLGEGEKIVDLGIGNLYLGEGRGEVFLPREYAKDLVDSFRLFSDPKISDILPSYDKDGEDGFDSDGCELRYYNGKLSLVDASGKVYRGIEKYDKNFNFYRYISQLGLERTGLAGGEAGDKFEPEKERFRDKHPNLFKGAAIGAACLLPVGFGIGAYCTSDNSVKNIVKDIKESDFAKYISHAAAKDINPNKNNVSKGIYKPTSPIKTIEDNRDEDIAFDTGKGGYPSIPGEHEGNFTPKKPMNISKVYTYPSPGTGGHTEKIAFLYQNGTEIGNASWSGYKGDWHNISFDEPVKLEGNEVYKYMIKTGSYPQIIHKQNLSNSDGIITCSEFTDANSKKYNNGIPAFKLFEEVVIPDTTPPGPVTGLNESKVGQKYINWSWNKPPDEDFKGVKIYLDDAFVGDLEGGTNWYNVTNLTEDTLHKLGVRPYDKAGNIGEWTNDTAKTLKIPNQNPIAIFNYNPKNPKVNQSILFNASNSYDPDGEIDQYLWDFNNDNITDAYGKTSNHSYSAAGIKQAILKVIDNQGADNQTSREINVLANQVPIVNIGGPYSSEVNKSVSFDAYATDPDGNITKYILEFGDRSNVSKIISPPQKQLNITELHNYSAADLYNAILKATDDNYEPGTNQTQVNITEPPGNKTWEEMNFTERKGLVELFLDKDPTEYEDAGTCGWVAYRGYHNATNAKELYGLEDDIPMCLVNSIIEGAPFGHMTNAVLIKNNKTNFDDWAFVRAASDEINLNPSQQAQMNNSIINIWGKGEWLEDYFNRSDFPDGLNCSEHQAKFKLIGKDWKPPERIIVLNETAPYIIYPATNAKDL